MANIWDWVTDEYWVDTALGSGDDDGTSPANSKRGVVAIKTGFEVDHDAGVACIVRRTSAYDEAIAAQDADISPTADGTAALPVVFIGWPRGAIPDTTITEGDWTNGSTTVDNIVGITCARLAHQARWITAPNGHKYLIARVIDSNTVVIDREYAGGTVTGVDGKFQIEEDEDYVGRPQAGIDAGWDADSHNLPTIDFNDEAYQIYCNGSEYLSFRNFNMIDSSDVYGNIRCNNTAKFELLGCLIKQNTSNAAVLSFFNTWVLERFVIEGSGSGSSQNGIGYAFGSNFDGKLKDGAIYNCGNHGIVTNGIDICLKNVNVGVEIANGDDDIMMSRGGMVKGTDVKLGGSNGYVIFDTASSGLKCSIENYQKILGEHKSWNFSGESDRVAVIGTNANKKLSDYVLKISPNQDRVFVIDNWKQEYFVGNFDLDAGAHTIKYWIYNDTGDTLNDTHGKENIYLEGKYINSYDDTSEYTITDVLSPEIDIIQAADADAWTQLSLTFTLATAGRVKVSLRVAKYEATAYILVDPESVIT